MLFGLAALAFAAAAPAATSTCSPPATGSLHAVRYVIDGDTVILDDGTHVRLIGLNTTELGHGHGPDQPLARAAREQLHKWLSRAGNRVRVVPGRETRDRHGRLLAHLYTPGGQNLEAALIRAGLGYAVAIPPDITRLQCYFDAEAAAREAHLGLWDGSSLPVTGAEAVSSGARGFLAVHGRIAGTRQAGGGLVLTLADSPLRLWVAPASRHFFPADITDWRGRRVLVRGWIHSYRGHPEMNLPHPADIQLLDGTDAAPREGS